MTIYIRRRDKECQECGKPVLGRRPNAVYCTAACQADHNRQAKRAGYAPVRVARPCADCGTTSLLRPKSC